MSDDLAAVPAAARRVAGQHARETQRRFAHRAIRRISVVVAAMVIAVCVFGLGWTAVAIEILVIVATLTTDRALSPLVERWGRGAAGEERVGAVLDGMRGRGWLALHDVPTGRGNIDHILIGPAGIFTIETKSRQGRIRAERIDPQFLRQAYAQAKTVERALGLRVEPLLVFSDAYLLPAVSRRHGVSILPARMLTRHLHQRDGKIPAARVAEVHAQLASSIAVLAAA